MFRDAQLLVFFALYLLVFVMAVVALVDAARRPPEAFVRAGKRTKGFWLAVLGLAAAVSFVSLPPLGASLGFLVLLAAVGAGVYLADVRPALGPHRRGGPGAGGASRGGW